MKSGWIVKILMCLSLFCFIWLASFFGLGEYDQIVLRNVKKAQIKIERNPKYRNIYSLECFQERLYCMSESESKILVYNLQGKYIKTIQLPYSPTGYNYISINNEKLYIDCANGNAYEYDGKTIVQCKQKGLSQLEKKEVKCKDSKYYIDQNKLIKEKNKRETVLKSENLLFWSIRNANVTLVITIILFASLFLIKKLS